MAPEVLQARMVPFNGIIADIFSLGVLFFTIAFGAPPFHKADSSDMQFKFIQKKPGNLDFFKYHPNTRTQFREGIIDPNLQTLILAMLCADPNDRI
jgi:serine/threonine protein kinase